MAINAKELNAALEAIEVSKGVSRETVLNALREAMIKGFKKDIGFDDVEVDVVIDSDNGIIDMFQIKKVVKDVEDDYLQISVEDANKDGGKYKEGDDYRIPASVEDLRKNIVMSIKSVFRQKFSEAEKEILYEQFKDKIGTMITGRVEQVDSRGATINIGRTSVYMPRKEMIKDENFVMGDNIKIFVESVASGTKGAHIVVSRACPGFLAALMSEEIHDIYDGTIVIKAIAREAGERSKVAVYSDDPNIDPAGNCIGIGGTRIQKVVSQLGNGSSKEKIDVIVWSERPELFILEALKPAKIVGINVDEEAKAAIVVVKDDSLSLAIGRKGVNARLAVKLTGYNIDIKVESEALESGLEFVGVEELEAMQAEEKAKRISEAAKASLVYQRDAEGSLPGVLEGYVAPQARQYEEEANDFDNTLEETVEKEEAVTVAPVKEEAAEVEEAPVVEEVAKEEAKEVEVKTTTTLEDLEKSLASSSKDNKKSSSSKRKKKVEEEKKEESVVRNDGPRMSIYSEEELAELEAEEEENEPLEDEEDIDYDEYDQYYDEN